MKGGSSFIDSLFNFVMMSRDKEDIFLGVKSWSVTRKNELR
jgi:hypothetical protein